MGEAVSATRYRCLLLSGVLAVLLTASISCGSPDEAAEHNATTIPEEQEASTTPVEQEASLTPEEQDALDLVHQLDVDDPSACRSFAPALLKATFGSLEACLAGPPAGSDSGSGVPSLSNEEVTIDGDSAVVTGTASDGEFTFGLVKRGGKWKLASFQQAPAP